MPAEQYGIDIVITVEGDRRALSSLNRIDRNTQKIDKSVNRLRRSFLRLFAPLFGAYGIYRATRAFVSLSNEAIQLENRIRLVTKSQEELTNTYNALFEISQKTLTPIRESATLFERFRRSTNEAEISSARLLKVVRGVNEAVLISGVGAQSASGALVQFAQGLAAGALRGQELNSVSEQTPRLFQALKDGLGLTAAEFRELATEGKITTEALTLALETQLPRLAGELNRVTRSISHNMVLVRNEVVNVVKEIDDQYEITDAINGLLQDTGKLIANIPGILRDANIEIERFLSANEETRKTLEFIVNFGRTGLFVIARITDTVILGWKTILDFVNEIFQVLFTNVSRLFNIGELIDKGLREVDWDGLFERAEMRSDEFVKKLAASFADLNASVNNQSQTSPGPLGRNNRFVIDPSLIRRVSEAQRELDRINLRGELGGSSGGGSRKDPAQTLREFIADLRLEKDLIFESNDERRKRLELLNLERQVGPLLTNEKRKEIELIFDEIQADKELRTLHDGLFRQLNDEREALSRALPERERFIQLRQLEHQLGRQLLPLERALLDILLKQSQELQRRTGILDQVRQGENERIQNLRVVNQLLREQQQNQTLTNQAIRELELLQANLILQNTGESSWADVFNAQLIQLRERIGNFKDIAIDAFGNIGNAIAGAFDPLIDRYLFGIGSAGEALKAIGRTIVKELIGALIKLGVQYAVNATLAKTSIVTTSAAVGTSMGVIAATAAPAAALVSLATVGGNAIPAQAGLISTTATAKTIAALSAFSPFREGGYVSGRGGPRSDSILARISDGEFVVNAAATRENRDTLERINRGEPAEPRITIINNISTPDADSFRESDDQIAAGNVAALLRSL